MKPDWDALADEYANSDKVLIADVDCTGAGDKLCERFGVEGFPTIKTFAPPDDEGEDYEGGRDLESLNAHASSIGPSCLHVSCIQSSTASAGAVSLAPVAYCLRCSESRSGGQCEDL